MKTCGEALELSIWLGEFFRSDNEARGSNIEIILIGGGTAEFTDRPTILGADYPYTPIYKEIATFTIPGS